MSRLTPGRKTVRNFAKSLTRSVLSDANAHAGLGVSHTGKVARDAELFGNVGSPMRDTWRHHAPTGHSAAIDPRDGTVHEKPKHGERRARDPRFFDTVAEPEERRNPAQILRDMKLEHEGITAPKRGSALPSWCAKPKAKHRTPAQRRALIIVAR